MHYAPIYRLSLVSDGRLPYETALRQSSDVAKFVRPLFDGLDREQFVVVLVNAKHRPIGAHVVSIGSLTASIVHPRETFKCAVAGNAECDLHLSQSSEWQSRAKSRRHRDHAEASRMWRIARHPLSSITSSSRETVTLASSPRASGKPELPSERDRASSPGRYRH